MFEYSGFIFFLAIDDDDDDKELPFTDVVFREEVLDVKEDADDFITKDEITGAVFSAGVQATLGSFPPRSDDSLVAAAAENPPKVTAGFLEAGADKPLKVVAGFLLVSEEKLPRVVSGFLGAAGVREEKPPNAANGLLAPVYR